MTELAEGPHLGAEVLLHAGALDGVPHGRGAALLPAYGLGRGDRRDGDRVAQVQEAHLDRGPAEHLLAQQRIGLDATHLPLLVTLRGRPAGLVVDDRQRPVGADVEAVDDPAQPQAVVFDFDAELHADGLYRRGVFQTEVVVDELVGVGQEGGGLVGAETELNELGVLPEFGPGVGQLVSGRRSRAARLAWFQKRPSRAECTSVPLTACGDGGSGRCSITA